MYICGFHVGLTVLLIIVNYVEYDNEYYRMCIQAFWQPQDSTFPVTDWLRCQFRPVWGVS